MCVGTHTHTQKRSLLHYAVKVLLNGFGEQINHYCYLGFIFLSFRWFFLLFFNPSAVNVFN